MAISARMTTIALISTFVIVGAVLRLFFALTLPVAWDSGIFLNWASSINNGATPYRDFFIRDPVYIYIVAVSTRLFGSNYFALSLISIIPGAATIPVIYKVVQGLFDERSGLFAAAIYSVAPTVIWFSTVFDERTLMLFLSVCALWVLVKGLRRQNPWFFITYGLVLGVSTFVYRGIAIYLMTVPILFGYLTFSTKNRPISRFGQFLTYSSASILGYAVSFGFIFFYFSLSSSFSWMISTFGFGGQQESASYFIFGEIAAPSFKTRILDVAVREWTYLIVPAGVLVLILVTNRLVSRRKFALTIAGLVVSGFLITSIAGLRDVPQNSYGAYEPTSVFNYAFLGFLALLPSLGGALFTDLACKTLQSRRHTLGPMLVSYWLLSTALLVALFGVPLVNYYYYFAPILTILAAPIIKSTMGLIRPPRIGKFAGFSRNPTAILFIGLLTLNAALTAGMLLTTQMTWRNQTLSTVYKVASYLQANTSPQDEILVGNPSIALFAHRRTVLGITELQIYGKLGPEPFNPMPYDPFHLFPNVSQIAQFMSSGSVMYVVGDDSPPVLRIMSLHPLWQRAFTTNFVRETTIDGIPIFRYSPVWDLSKHLGTVGAYSNSTPYHFANGTWLDGFNHSMVFSAGNVSLPTVAGLTMPIQVAFYPPAPAGKSFIQISFTGNKYSNLTTSFALADSAGGKSTGVKYFVNVTSGGQQIASFGAFVTTNSWQQAKLALPTGANLTIVLSSASGQSSMFDWLQITFTLQP